MLATDPLTFISSALAPVVSLSACAILASNAQSQYSSLIDRLRMLNAEKREYEVGLASGDLNEIQVARLKSLTYQIPVFFRRAHVLKNAMTLLFLGMMFILLTSFMIILDSAFTWPLLSWAAKWCFFIGLSFVFCGVLAKLIEVSMTFRVVRYELGIFDLETAQEAEVAFKAY